MPAFAGTDASRGLAKMDLKSTQYGIDDLTASEKNTLREVSFSSRRRDGNNKKELQAAERMLQPQRQESVRCSLCVCLFSIFPHLVPCHFQWKEKYEVKYPIVGKIVDFSQANSGQAPPNGQWGAQQ